MLIVLSLTDRLRLHQSLTGLNGFKDLSTTSVNFVLLQQTLCRRALFQGLFILDFFLLPISLYFRSVACGAFAFCLAQICLLTDGLI